MQLISNVSAELSGKVSILNNPKIVNQSGNDYKDVRAFVEDFGYIDLFVKDTAAFYNDIERHHIVDVAAHNGYFVVDTPYIDKDKKQYLVVTSAV